MDARQGCLLVSLSFVLVNYRYQINTLTNKTPRSLSEGKTLRLNLKIYGYCVTLIDNKLPSTT